MTGRNILMAWELGGGIGHVSMFQTLAEPLMERGAKISLALRDLEKSAGLFNDDVRLFQAPIKHGLTPIEPKPVASLAHILYNTGFGHTDVLKALVLAWRQLFKLADPDLLIVDHSPTALLAARGLGLRTMFVGNGFFCPPIESPLPPLTDEDLSQLLVGEQVVLDNANVVMDELDGPPLARLADLYDDFEAKYFVTLPPLDHYGQRSDANYCGIWPKQGGQAFTWPTAPIYGAKRVFCYIEPFDSIDTLFETLRVAGHPTVVFAGSHGPTLAKKWSGPTIRFETKPIDMNQAIAEADLVVTHGTTTAEQSLLGGTPVLRIPRHQEQQTHAARCAATGGSLTGSSHDNNQLATALSQMFGSDEFTVKAREFSSQHQSYARSTMMSEITQIAIELAG